MRLTDTHTHIYCEEFDTDRQEVICRAEAAGVVRMILPAIDEESHERQAALAASRPDLFDEMMGLHPTSVNKCYAERLVLTKNRLFAAPNHYVAVGEIGLDFYWDRSFEKEQIAVLQEQLAWAVQLSKPVALHVRDAYEEMIQILNNKAFIGIQGVFHCYSGTAEQAQEIVAKGFYLGIGGVVTFKKSQLADIVKITPLESLLLETDSPYLAPTPYRGKRNESAHIATIAQKVAEIKDIDVETVAEITSQNAQKLFGSKSL